MIGPLVRLPLARLLRTRRSWVSAGAWFVLALAMALAAHSRGVAHGTDHVLVDAYGVLVLPLLAFTLVGAALGGRSLSSSTAPVVAFGAPPSRAAAATVAVAGLVCGLLGGALAALVALVAHGVADPPRVPDAFASAYAGGLGGLAYAAWFALGAAFGRRGGGRVLALAADWVFGAGSGIAALFTPRANLRSLLGGSPPMGLSERASAIVLVAIACACTVGAMRRARA